MVSGHFSPKVVEVNVNDVVDIFLVVVDVCVGVTADDVAGGVVVDTIVAVGSSLVECIVGLVNSVVSGALTVVVIATCTQAWI